jgi:cysteine desulfuration protein SufE
MSIHEREQEIIEEFELLGDDWELKYEHLIELGKSLPLIKPELKTDERLIKGCQSRVWLQSERNNSDNTITYTADSDAIITRGIIALMVRVLSGNKAEDIMNAPLNFIDKIGLKEHLSPTRANGLLSMIKQMKMDALVLSKAVNN